MRGFPAAGRAQTLIFGFTGTGDDNDRIPREIYNLNTGGLGSRRAAAAAPEPGLDAAGDGDDGK